MLPIEAIFFVPSLLIVPIAIVALLVLRKRKNYPRVWRIAVFVCITLIALYSALTLRTPLYSERSHRPDNPGGFSVGLWAVVGEFLLWTCVAIPAFPLLTLLAILPPEGRSNHALIAICLLYVVVLAGLVIRKNAIYLADYRTETSMRQQTPFARFK